MDRNQLIETYERGVDEVLAAVDGLTDDDLDRPATDGGWTARQVVHHLADSEMTSAIRLRRLLVEDAPDVGAYDEEAFAAALAYAERPIAPALKAFVAARETSAQLLRRLDDAQWARAGTHPEHGSYSVADWLRIYAAHAHDHAEQIRRAVARA
ncbi:MAG TPA: DinB family protein [Acidimicrobiales bacterium]